MKNLLCIIHSPSENTKLIRDKIIQEIQNQNLKLNLSILNPFEAKSDDVIKADGLILGTTENLASMAGATKDFFDRTYYSLLNKKEGLPIVIWIRAGHDGTGSTRQIKSIISGLKWRLVQDILVCKGSWNKSFVDDCTELCVGFSIGLETNIY